MNDEDYTPPNPYDKGLAVLRSAAANQRNAQTTPESRFAEQSRQERMAELEIEHAALDADIEANPPRLRHLTAVEEEEMSPRSPYDAPIAALRAKR